MKNIIIVDDKLVKRTAKKALCILYFENHHICHVINQDKVMAKSKNKRPTRTFIEVTIVKVSETGECIAQVDEIEVQDPIITQSFLLAYYENYLQKTKQRVVFEYDMYTPDLDNHVNLIKIGPDFELKVDELIEANCTLMLIIKSKILEVKRILQEQIYALRSQLYIIKDQLSQLSSIRDQIESLKKNNFGSTGFLSHQQSFFQKHHQIQLDLAILFSEPLFDQEKKKSTPPAVDFRSQINMLHQSLQNSYKPNITMKCEIATIQTLKNLIKYSKPKILHIICHGNSEGSLQFEDDSRSKLGHLHLLKSQDLKNLLKNYLNDIPELVFVNSCHSEKIGKTFFQIGVKYVIMIDSEDTISDQAAEIFSEHFYRKIFRGENILQAFYNSKKQVQINHHSYQCCCNHSAQQPHRTNCRWTTIITRKHPYAHRDYHVPSAKCKCKMRNFNRHQINCQWAKKVLFEINEDFRKPVEEGSTQYEFPRLKSDFPDYFDSEKKQLVICCCPTKGKIPHNESYKFKILYKQGLERDGLFQIKNTNEKPDIIDYSSTQLLEAHVKEKNIYGRQKQLFTFIKNMREYQQSLYLVHGVEGVGLTTFSVKAASYLMERRVFEYFFFIDLYEIRDSTLFRFKFNEVTKFDLDNEMYETSIKTKKILFLLDNCDDFLKISSRQFYAELQTLIREFPKSKIIFILKDNNYQQFNQKELHSYSFELPPLDPRQARALLNMRLKDKTDITVGINQYKKLVKEYDVLKIPKVINSLSHSFSRVDDRITYQMIQNNIKQVELSDTNTLTLSVLENLQKSDREVYDFLIFISQFSEGVSQEDLNMFSTYDNKQQSSFEHPIKKNWKKHYEYLMHEQKGTREIPKNTLKLVTSVTTYSPKTEDKFEQFIQESKPLKMKQKESELDSNALKSVEKQSYYIEALNRNSFIVKRFIRDYVWNKCEGETIYKMKFLFIAYFSAVLQLLFHTLRGDYYFHEELLTYSEISQSGAFSFQTDLQSTYRERNSLSGSVCMAKKIQYNIQNIFLNNQLLNKKIKEQDPSLFILAHQQDFLKIYDYNWQKIYEHLKNRGENEQNIFLCFLENLLVYIPTALKIAHAEDSLIKYVISRSQNQLLQLKSISKSDRSLKIQLKLAMLKVGVNLKEEGTVNQIVGKTRKILETSERSFTGDNKGKLKQIRNIFEDESNNIDLYFELTSKTDPQKKFERLLAYQDKIQKQMGSEPILRAKQQLLLCLNFLQFCRKYQLQMITILSQIPNFKDRIIKLCEAASEAFERKSMRKLQLKSDLTSISLFWELNLKFQKGQIDTNQFYEIDKWRQILLECEKIYHNSHYRLGGFTEFDDQIKTMKKEMKKKLWKSTQNSIIFLKSYPISFGDDPFILNLIRKKNTFRKTFEQIFKEKVAIQKSQPPKLHKESKRKDSFLKKEKEMSLDISAKYEILSMKKLEQEIETGCSVMVISTQIKAPGGIHGKVSMVVENNLMAVEQVDINSQFANKFDFNKVNILVLVGENASAAMERIQRLNKKKVPYIISLSSQPQENEDDYHESDGLNSKWLREYLLQSAMIKQQQLYFLKYLLKRIVRKRIEGRQQLKRIYDEVEDRYYKRYDRELKLKPRLGAIQKCQNIFINYKEGTYKDLSPGYERNHNISNEFYNQRPFIVRRWKQMQDIFSYVQGKQYFNPSDIFGSQQVDYQSQTTNSHVSYINIYGELGSGKSYFIHEIAKILVERQLYDYGVYLLDGREIEKKCQGDFQIYIKKKAKKGKMPVYEDFQKILGQKTILIIDDFHLIKPRTNARMKLFLDKILSRKVSLILVSVNELKLEWIDKMKRVKINRLDKFETEILAYNMLDLNSEIELGEYEQLRDSKVPTVGQIRQIKERRNEMMEVNEASEYELRKMRSLRH